MNLLDRLRGLSGASRALFWIILITMALVGLIAFFTSEAGRTISLLCCGALVLLVIVGIVSEGGMRRPR